MLKKNRKIIIVNNNRKRIIAKIALHPRARTIPVTQELKLRNFILKKELKRAKYLKDLV